MAIFDLHLNLFWLGSFSTKAGLLVMITTIILPRYLGSLYYQGRSIESNSGENTVSRDSALDFSMQEKSGRNEIAAD